MGTARQTSTPAPGWLVLIAIWSVVGLAAGLLGDHGGELPRGDAVLWSLACWLPWALVTPAVLGLVRRAPLDGERVVARLFGHGVALLVIASARSLWSAIAGKAIVGGRLEDAGLFAGDVSLFALAESLFGATLLVDLLAYSAVVAAGMAMEYRRRWREGQISATALEAKLSKARLEALKMQLHPHFLFNTLHAVGVLVRKRDTRGALRMLIGLSDLLRITLDSSGKQVVPLRQELDFLERYLRVEQVRFGGSLEVDKHIDREVLGAMVPNLALQPLLENAIRHGIAPRDAPGSISLKAKRTDGNRLRLEVADDGIGLAEDSAELSGMGLANVRARLDQLYGDAHQFEICDREDRPGVVAIIEIPLRFEDEASSHDG